MTKVVLKVSTLNSSDILSVETSTCSYTGNNSDIAYKKRKNKDYVALCQFMFTKYVIKYLANTYEET
jgi:hypothetical protein